MTMKKVNYIQPAIEVVPVCSMMVMNSESNPFDFGGEDIQDQEAV